VSDLSESQPGGSLLTESPYEPTKLLERGIRTLLGRGATYVLSFAFAVAAARMLDPAGRGRFALLQALAGLGLVVGNLAISAAIVFHLGRRLVSAGRAAGAAWILSLLSGLLAVLVLAPVSLVLRDRLFPGISPLLIVGAVLLATPMFFRDYSGGVLIALGRPERFMLSHALQPVVALALLLALVVSGGGGFDAVVVAWAVAIIVSGLAAIGLCLGLIGERPRFLRQDVTALGRFGARTYAALLTRFLNLRLDQFLVQLLSSVRQLGYYAVAVNVGELLLQIPVIMLWAFSGSVSASTKEESAALVAQFSRWVIVLMGSLSLVVAVIAPLAVPLVFGSRYRPALQAVLLLLPGMICYGPAVLISEYFIVQRGQPGKAVLIPGLSAVANVLLNLMLTGSLGATGAALASSLSYGLMLLVAIGLFSRDTGLTTRDLVAVSRVDLRGIRSAIRRGAGAPVA
jgi:O-antigen/teichoic acid export membrane protein